MDAFRDTMVLPHATMTTSAAAPAGSPDAPASTPQGLAWLAAVEARGKPRVYPARAIILHEGEDGDSLYVIRSGRGKVFSTNGAGKEIVFATFGPGDVLGEASLDGGPRTASVMTLEETHCVVVPTPVVKELVARDPALAWQIVCSLIRLLRASSDNIKSLALEDVYSRVVRLLMKHAEPDGEGWVVTERMSRQQIADRVGSSREMVSRIFKELEAGKYLAVDAKRIAILRKPPPGW